MTYCVTGFAYLSWIATLKMPPTVVIEATQPWSHEKTMVPACDWDWEGLIGRVSLPTWPAAVGGVQSAVGVLAAVVVVVVVVTVDFSVDVLVDADVDAELDAEVEFEMLELEVEVLEDELAWSCA
jgi:hypothetical protein